MTVKNLFPVLCEELRVIVVEGNKQWKYLTFFYINEKSCNKLKCVENNAMLNVDCL